MLILQHASGDGGGSSAGNRFFFDLLLLARAAYAPYIEQQLSPNILLAQPSQGTHAYILTYRGARKLLSMCRLDRWGRGEGGWEVGWGMGREGHGIWCVWACVAPIAVRNPEDGCFPRPSEGTHDDLIGRDR